jgi:hypothetical protein
MNAGRNLQYASMARTRCLVKATIRKESCRQTRGRWRQFLDRSQHLMLSGFTILLRTERVRPKPSTSGRAHRNQVVQWPVAY